MTDLTVAEPDAFAVANASKLAGAIDRARKALDDGDVETAKNVAGLAYGMAAALAKNAGRSIDLVGKARQMQGDALLVESRAWIRIATEFDAAQAAGLIGKSGRPKTVPDENGLQVATIADLGLTRKEIHAARQLAEAERAEPGFVEQTIATRLAAMREPSRGSLRAAIGTRSASNEDRGNNLYETAPEAMRVLLALEAFSPTVYEPASGKFAIVRKLTDAGYGVLASDLVDYGTGATRIAFCDTRRPDDMTDAEVPDIVTNPPYGDGMNAFIAHALREWRSHKVAMLLNLNAYCGFEDADRNFILDEQPPARMYVFSRRLPMMHRDGYDGKKASSQMNCAWVVWDRSHVGKTTVERVDWNLFLDRPALPARKPRVTSPARPKAKAERARATPKIQFSNAETRWPISAALSGKLRIGGVAPIGEDGFEWAIDIRAGGRVKDEATARRAVSAKWRELLRKAGIAK